MSPLDLDPAGGVEENGPAQCPSACLRTQPLGPLSVAVAEPEASEAAPADEYRLRFLNFNMANSSSFSSVSALQGPGGRGDFETTFTEPFPDGGAVDLAFVTLVETRLPLSDWLQQRLAKEQGPLDMAATQNACREGSKEAGAWQVHGWLEGLAANYNGNLKSVLAFSSRRFEQDRALVLHGRLTETKVAGLAVPNPKKAFIGRTMHASGIRICFVGAHFPIANTAAALEEPVPGKSDPLQVAKLGLARILRKVLRRACRRGILDGETLLVLQGDLNSRTVLQASGASDLLQEVMRDGNLQAAMQHQLGLPPGRWREVPSYSNAHGLPVTYKFRDRPGHAFEQPAGDAASWGSPSLTLGDVLTAARASFPPPTGVEGPELYRRILKDVPSEQLKAWGIVFKEGDFRPFRFPASADRVIYWASNGLASRLSWIVHRGGYQIHHTEKGSDHRPVSLEVTLRIAMDQRPSVPSTADSEAEPLAKEVCQSDTEESDQEAPSTTSSFWSFMGKGR
mmetsp:Transcript_48902/g.151547  ORF Transcript_48902/g.151547 Transcript_48902/m.151547 type:complete len:510 (-) Transcript_48902:105-1634(-)